LANDIVSPEITSGRFEPVHLNIFPDRIQFGIITRANEYLDPITEQFVGILRNVASQKGQTGGH